MCDVKEMLVASPFFPLQWSLGMRWCHQSSVYVIEKKCLVVPSFAKVKTHTEVKLCLVLNKTMTLFLRCLEWSVPTFCVFGGQLNGSHDKVKAIPRWNFRGLKSLCSRFEIWFDWLGLGLVEPYEKRRGRNSVGRGRLRVSIISYIWLLCPFCPCD